jgi:hypothetical protein
MEEFNKARKRHIIVTVFSAKEKYSMNIFFTPTQPE